MKTVKAEQVNAMVKTFEVASPEELRETLAAEKTAYALGLAVIRVFGSAVVTRYFEHSKGAMPGLMVSLEIEAGQSLSIDPRELVIAVQYLSTQGDVTRGVMTAMSRENCEAYLKVFDQSPLIPVALMSSTAGSVADHLQAVAAPGRDYCLVNFIRPGVVSAVVFLEGEPVFFREMHDATDPDIEHWLSDTIRYCCGRSASKQIDDVIVHGQTEGKEKLIAKVRSEVVFTHKARSLEPQAGMEDFEPPNLFKGRVLARTERSVMSRVLTWALILATAAALLGGIFAADALVKIKLLQAAEVHDAK